LGDAQVVVIAPRLVLRLADGKERPPLGHAVWKDTWLNLGASAADRVYRNLFTGEALAPESQHGKRGLLLGDALRNFPVALLQRMPA
jgi:maltooligosyltrehalose synthase